MSENRSALVVASWEYQDADLRRLVAPANDAEALARVLRDPKMGGFEVTTLLNKTSREMSEEIEGFFLNRKRDDLLLLYFSGHGLKDDDGLLYFTASDTRLIDHSRPMRSTAISAEFVREVMRCSNSRRQVLMLDCCYSGAFAGAMMSKGDKSVGVKQQLDHGRGLVVITASDALQYSFEGDKVEGDAARSVFTSTIVHGIETGEADLDRDGCIALDELYDYVYAKVTDMNNDQTPRKWTLDVEGKIIVSQAPIVRAAELPSDLLAAISSPLQRVRLGAVEELGDLLQGNHKGLALAAREALSRLAKDDSRIVSVAAESLIAPPQIEEVDNPFYTSVPRLSEEDLTASLKRSPVAPDPSSPVHGIRELPDFESRFPEVIPAADLGYLPRKDPAHVEPPPIEPPHADSPHIVPPIIVSPGRDALQTDRSEAVKPLPADAAPRRFFLPFPLPWVVLLGVIILVFILWRTVQRTAQPQVQQQGMPSTTAEMHPVLLAQPPWEYFASAAATNSKRATKVRMVEISEKKNEITDTDEWFGNNELSLPTMPNDAPFDQANGNSKSEMPAKLITMIRSNYEMLNIYGTDMGSGRYLAGFSEKSGKPLYSFDFRDFMVPPKFVDSERDFIKEAVIWAATEDGVLYVETSHSTYAKSSEGFNAYISAIDTKTGALLWRSAPLISNAKTFLLYKDAIIAGYGFTSEPDFLYVLNKRDGRVVQTLKLRKSPEYILDKGDKLYVRTYDTDYVFQINAG
ncbi:MAG TPA: caspase family protein [Acidisarcina sp.]